MKFPPFKLTRSIRRGHCILKQCPAHVRLNMSSSNYSRHFQPSQRLTLNLQLKPWTATPSRLKASSLWMRSNTLSRYTTQHDFPRSANGNRDVQILTLKSTGRNFDNLQNRRLYKVDSSHSTRPELPLLQRSSYPIKIRGTSAVTRPALRKRRDEMSSSIQNRLDISKCVSLFFQRQQGDVTPPPSPPSLESVVTFMKAYK